MLIIEGTHIEVVFVAQGFHGASSQGLGCGESVPDGEIPRLAVEIGVEIGPAAVGQQGDDDCQGRKPGVRAEGPPAAHPQSLQGQAGEETGGWQGANGAQSLRGLKVHGEDATQQQHDEADKEEKGTGLAPAVEAVAQAQGEEDSGSKVQHWLTRQVVAAIAVTPVVEHQQVGSRVVPQSLGQIGLVPLGEDGSLFGPEGESLPVVEGVLAQRGKDHERSQHEDDHAQPPPPHKAPFSQDLVKEKENDDERDKAKGGIGVQAQAQGQSAPKEIGSPPGAQTLEQKVEGQRGQQRKKDRVKDHPTEIDVPAGGGDEISTDQTQPRAKELAEEEIESQDGQHPQDGRDQAHGQDADPKQLERES